MDAAELLARAKEVQRRLYAEDYDEILSYEDLEYLVQALAVDEGTGTPSGAGAPPPPEVEAYGEDAGLTLEEICEKYGLTAEGVDYALGQYGRVICELTNGRMSKCTYSATDIISQVTDVFCDGCEFKEAAYGAADGGGRDE